MTTQLQLINSIIIVVIIKYRRDLEVEARGEANSPQYFFLPKKSEFFWLLSCWLQMKKWGGTGEERC